jgi:hypothetical protein
LKTVTKIILDGGITYEGQWKNNEKQGYGVQKWPNGARYEGQWEEGKATGLGKFFYANGDYY